VNGGYAGFVGWNKHRNSQLANPACSVVLELIPESKEYAEDPPKVPICDGVHINRKPIHADDIEKLLTRG